MKLIFTIIMVAMGAYLIIQQLRTTRKDKK